MRRSSLVPKSSTYWASDSYDDCRCAACATRSRELSPSTARCAALSLRIATVNPIDHPTATTATAPDATATIPAVVFRLSTAPNIRGRGGLVRSVELDRIGDDVVGEVGLARHCGDAGRHRVRSRLRRRRQVHGAAGRLTGERLRDRAGARVAEARDRYRAPDVELIEVAAVGHAQDPGPSVADGDRVGARLAEGHAPDRDAVQRVPVQSRLVVVLVGLRGRHLRPDRVGDPRALQPAQVMNDLSAVDLLLAGGRSDR